MHELPTAIMVVTAIAPMETFAARDDRLRPIAEEVRAKFVRVLDRIAGAPAGAAPAGIR